MSDARYEHLGSGELLPKACALFQRVVDDAGWGWSREAMVRDKAPEARFSFGSRRAVRSFPIAVLYRIVSPKWNTIIAPLGAKEYAITDPRTGDGKWFSISEKVLLAGMDVWVFVYLQELDDIRVGDRREAARDPGYLRYGQRMFGWPVTGTKSLKDFLAAPI